MVDTKLAESHADWQEANPLRSFRVAQKLQINATAGLLGVSLKTIQLWESGASNPTDANLERIAAMMKVKATTLRSRWVAWMKTSPYSSN